MRDPLTWLQSMKASLSSPVKSEAFARLIEASAAHRLNAEALTVRTLGGIVSPPCAAWHPLKAPVPILVNAAAFSKPMLCTFVKPWKALSPISLSFAGKMRSPLIWPQPSKASIRKPVNCVAPARLMEARAAQFPKANSSMVRTDCGITNSPVALLHMANALLSM